MIAEEVERLPRDQGAVRHDAVALETEAATPLQQLLQIVAQQGLSPADGHRLEAERSHLPQDLGELAQARPRDRRFDDSAPQVLGPWRPWIETLAAMVGAHVVDADLDRLHDAMFVETCAEELLPRIAALVGVRPLRPLPPSAAVSMRAFVGNVLHYRRAKGTPLTLVGEAVFARFLSALVDERKGRAMSVRVHAPAAPAAVQALGEGR